jgi:Immunity protein 8
MLAVNLKHLHSPDLDVGSLPPDPANCKVLVQATIGPTNVDGGDTFDFVVVTPAAVAALGACWGRGTLILPMFSWEEIERFLRRLIATSPGNDWPSVASVLGRELLWEFDGYRSGQAI